MAKNRCFLIRGLISNISRKLYILKIYKIKEIISIEKNYKNKFKMTVRKQCYSSLADLVCFLYKKEIMYVLARVGPTCYCNHKSLPMLNISHFVLIKYLFLGTLKHEQETV